MSEKRVLLKNIDPNRPGACCSFEQYVKSGGYEGARAALKKTPQEVQQIVTASGLRGRGGAGFPTGNKWSFVPMDGFKGDKYLICNADEMEPGTFKDRVLLYGDPHQLIEGMVIAAYAMQMNKGFVFIRYEYKKGAELAERAIAEAERAGWLGKNIQGSGWDFDLETHLSAGRYMCGEETALLNALEGKRANPRSKPPFPQTRGFLGQPTIVNNVETLCNLPHILVHGADWYKGLALGGNGGTKLMGASGRVKRPGTWELPMGTPLREVLEEYAGGPERGKPFKAVIPGGLSTPLLLPDKFDVAMDFDDVAKVGSRLGTAGVIVFDEGDCIVGATANAMQFYARESCGWCTPCREGIPWIYETVRAIEEGTGEPEDMAVLDDLAQHILYTFCAFAPGAQGPLYSAITLFRDEFEEHIKTRKCPLRSDELWRTK